MVEKQTLYLVGNKEKIVHFITKLEKNMKVILQQVGIMCMKQY